MDASTSSPTSYSLTGDSILFSTTISSMDNTSNDINESSTGSTPSTPTTAVGSGELGSVVHTPNNYGLTTVVYDIPAGIKHSERPLLDMLESLSIQQKQYLSQPRQSITRNDLWGKFMPQLSRMKISTTPSTKFFPKKSPSSSTITPTNNTKSPKIGKRSRPTASEYQFPHQLSNDDKISVVAALILANNLSINRTNYAEPTTDDIPLHVVVLAVLDKYEGLSENTRIHLLNQLVKYCSKFSADSVGTRIKKPEDYISQDERKKVTIEDGTSTTSSVVAEEQEVVSGCDWQSNDFITTSIPTHDDTSIPTHLTDKALATKWRKNLIQGLHEIDEVIENGDSFSRLKTKERLLHYSSINQIKVQQITLLYADHCKNRLPIQELKDKILKVLDGYVYYEEECKLIHI